MALLSFSENRVWKERFGLRTRFADLRHDFIPGRVYLVRCRHQQRVGFASTQHPEPLSLFNLVQDRTGLFMQLFRCD